MLDVFLLLAFTCLGHERKDVLSQCDEMHVCTDQALLFGVESEAMLTPREKPPLQENGKTNLHVNYTLPCCYNSMLVGDGSQRSAKRVTNRKLQLPISFLFLLPLLRFLIFFFLLSLL